MMSHLFTAEVQRLKRGGDLTMDLYSHHGELTSTSELFTGQ